MKQTAELPAPTTEDNGPTLALAERGKNYMHITVAQVEEAYAEPLAEGSVTREQFELISWLLTVCKLEKWNLAEISTKIGYNSTTTLYRVFRGKYEAELKNVLDKIEDFKKLYEQRRGVGQSVFVETSLSREIFTLCDLTRTYQVINPIYGDSQTGKSFALQEYTRRNNHGHTIYCVMPSNGHLFKFLVALCKALRISPKGNSVLLASRIVGALNENMLLIIDEIHQTCLGEKSGIKLNTLEFIRLEIYEAVKCGIVLCGTNVFRNEVEKGRHAAVLEQTRRRSMSPLQLPALLPRDDMDAIAASFGLPPANRELHELRVDIIKRHGLRAYSNFLRSGSKHAHNKKQEFTWAHFLSAHDALAKLSHPEAR